MWESSLRLPTWALHMGHSINGFVGFETTITFFLGFAANFWRILPARRAPVHSTCRWIMDIRCAATRPSGLSKIPAPSPISEGFRSGGRSGLYTFGCSVLQHKRHGHRRCRAAFDRSHSYGPMRVLGSIVGCTARRWRRHSAVAIFFGREMRASMRSSSPPYGRDSERFHEQVYPHPPTTQETPW
jgi:hypothetical protein